MAKQILTQDHLKELLYYNKQFGIFVRKKSMYRYKKGDIAGWLNNSGYIQIGIAGSQPLAHRLAFLYMTGSMPNDEVDHINGVRTDNRWPNLREATKHQNQKNSKINTLNTSGVMGVYLNKRSKKWNVQISVNGQYIYLGSFLDWFEAVCARKSAELKHNFHPNHGRRA